MFHEYKLLGVDKADPWAEDGELDEAEEERRSPEFGQFGGSDKLGSVGR